MKIRLSDEDRERLGAPDEIDCSSRLTVLEAEAIEEMLGIDVTSAAELMAPKREDVDEDTVRFRLKPKGVRLMVWLGLYRAGMTVAFDGLTFDYTNFIGSFEQAKRELGKAPSATSGSATPSKSRTTGRATRSRTSKTSI